MKLISNSEDISFSILHISWLLLLELGTGWAPAVADDAAELKLIQEQERISTDDRDYWIGGLAYDKVQNEGKF